MIESSCSVDIVPSASLFVNVVKVASWNFYRIHHTTGTDFYFWPPFAGVIVLPLPRGITIAMPMITIGLTIIWRNCNIAHLPPVGHRHPRHNRPFPFLNRKLPPIDAGINRNTEPIQLPASTEVNKRTSFGINEYSSHGSYEFRTSQCLYFGGANWEVLAAEMLDSAGLEFDLEHFVWLHLCSSCYSDCMWNNYIRWSFGIA